MNLTLNLIRRRLLVNLIRRRLLMNLIRRRLLMNLIRTRLLIRRKRHDFVDHDYTHHSAEADGENTEYHSDAPALVSLKAGGTLELIIVRVEVVADELVVDRVDGRQSNSRRPLVVDRSKGHVGNADSLCTGRNHD